MSITPSDSECHAPHHEKMIAVLGLSGIVTGDLEATASMFLSLYRVAPEEALSVLELLLAGDHQNQCTHSRLMN